MVGKKEGVVEAPGHKMLGFKSEVALLLGLVVFV